MSGEVLIAKGGFAPPTIDYGGGNAGVSFGLEALRHFPLFSATRGGIDWRPPHEQWAVAREKELRDERLAREAERELAAVEWPFELRGRDLWDW